MLNLAEELKEIRKKIGKTQTEIAKEFGIPQTTWASYEVGKATPPLKILFALAKQGYPINGLSTGTLEKMIEDGKITKAEAQKRIAITQAVSRAMGTDTADNDVAEVVSAVANTLEQLPPEESSSAPETSPVAADVERRLASIEFRLTSIERILQEQKQGKGE